MNVLEADILDPDESALLMEGLFGEKFFERRRSPRQKTNFSTVLVSDRAMLNFWEGTVLNCSPEGLGLKLTGPKPKPGGTLFVRRGNTPKLNASIPVQIIHCHRQDRSSYLVGCTFLEPPPPQVLVLFG